MQTLRRSVFESLPVGALAAATCALAIAIVLGACASSPEAPPASGTSPAGAQGEGYLAPEDIDGTILSRMFEFEKCYSDFARAHPDLASRQFDIKVNFVINAEGRVTHAAVEPTAPRSPSLNACVVQEMKKILFPKPNPSGNVRVKYPFWFNRK